MTLKTLVQLQASSDKELKKELFEIIYYEKSLSWHLCNFK